MALYLDCNATTPVDPAVVAAMEPYWSQQFGNPSSSHRVGRSAKNGLDRARQQVAELAGASSHRQVIFTGSGTEANHLALLGMAASFEQPGTVAIGATEHASLFGAAAMLQAQGWQLMELPVDALGQLQLHAMDVDQLQAIDLLSVMVANNETGVLQDLEKLAWLRRESGAKLHIDATQAGGKIPLNFSALEVDCMTLSAHKLYGPKGVGALIVDSALKLYPQLQGGGQERGIRSGTENIPAIVGFGAAAELAQQTLEARAAQQLKCRQLLEQGLMQMSGVEIVAQQARRLPNTVMCLVDGIEGETLLMQLDQQGIALSSGSACQVGKTAPNKVLTAMGITPEAAKGAIRISLCRNVTETEIEHFLQVLRGILMPSEALWGAVG